MRNKSIQEKIQMLMNKFRDQMPDDFNFNPDLIETVREEIVGFVEYFHDKDVHFIDLPACVVPHPENRRRLIDPELRGVPAEKTISVDSRSFPNMYDLVDEINHMLDNNMEVFIYTIQFVLVFEPTRFEAIKRPIIRLKTIDKSYWYTPLENNDDMVVRMPRRQVVTDILGRTNRGPQNEPVRVNTLHELRDLFGNPEEVETNLKEPIKIDKNINKHNFGDT
jgi:hypothetical protein